MTKDIIKLPLVRINFVELIRGQQKAIKARQLAERQDVQLAHNMQFNEFNQAWDKYMEEYDSMAQMYIQQMTERHASTLREFQEDLHRQLMKRPPKYSKELLDWRRRQNMLARQKNYAEAQKIKRIADVMEERERKSIDTENRKIFARKEAQLRKQQQAELQALLKRIEGRRREHIKQRNLDYPHGTGHGVGFFLNVHEGPQSISKINKVKIKEGMILSNEPGYYKKDKFGIRIENLIYVKKNKNKLYFENLTLAPIDKDLINFDLLTNDEKNYLWKYNLDIYTKLHKYLNPSEKRWLATFIQ